MDILRRSIMPPKVKITKNDIVNTAVELVRVHGEQALNARSIATALGCSTQPVLYSFRTMDEIRQAAYEIADEYHTAFILPKETDADPMLALGLNYVRFGHEEKNLFRFLFQSTDLLLDSLIVDVLQILNGFLTLADSGRNICLYSGKLFSFRCQLPPVIIQRHFPKRL